MQSLIKFILGLIFLVRKLLLTKWQYFLWNQRVQYNNCLRKYYANKCNHNPAKRQVVFMVNGFILHGGLVDRIKGILSVYSWCQSREVEFKVYFVSPFLLSEYLLSNSYDWTIDEKDILYDDSTKVLHLMLYHPLTSTLSKPYIDKHFRKWMDKECLNHQGQIHIYTNVDCCQESYDRLFSTLFKTSNKLETLLNQTIKEINSKYITISFRFTTLLGDFFDVINAELSIKEQNLLINKCLKAINTIRSKYSTDIKIIVLSDSNKFLSAVANMPSITVLPGHIGHIEHNSDQATHLKTFLDFLIISRATKAYLVKSQQMYNSAFPSMAALIGNIPFEKIEI